MNRTQIREIFLRNGFSIKPGCDDLKSYVYEAAEELLNLAEVERLSAVQGELVGYVNPQLLPLLGSRLEGLMVRKSKTANRTFPLYASPLTASEGRCMSNQNVRPDVSQLNTSEYIHKQKTHIVNGVEIPDLRVTPEHGDSYYLVDPTIPELATLYKFTGTVIDEIWVERGLAYQPTEEGKQAAILHAKAMLGVASGATTQGVAAQDEQYPPCDFCGVIPDHHPWHGSGMFKGVDSPHIHACNGCRHLLPSRTAQPTSDVAELVEALEEARLTLEVMQGRGSSARLTLAIIDRAIATHRKEPASEIDVEVMYD